jgi:hypothetical protein
MGYGNVNGVTKIKGVFERGLRVFRGDYSASSAIREYRSHFHIPIPSNFPSYILIHSHIPIHIPSRIPNHISQPFPTSLPHHAIYGGRAAALQADHPYAMTHVRNFGRHRNRLRGYAAAAPGASQLTASLQSSFELMTFFAIELHFQSYMRARALDTLLL